MKVQEGSCIRVRDHPFLAPLWPFKPMQPRSRTPEQCPGPGNPMPGDDVLLITRPILEIRLGEVRSSSGYGSRAHAGSGAVLRVFLGVSGELVKLQGLSRMCVTRFRRLHVEPKLSRAQKLDNEFNASRPLQTRMQQRRRNTRNALELWGFLRQGGSWGVGILGTLGKLRKPWGGVRNLGLTPLDPPPPPPLQNSTIKPQTRSSSSCRP